MLGLGKRKVLAHSPKALLKKLLTYCPHDVAEKVRMAMFNAGAGKIGDYDSCCWQTSGQGQFRPLEGSTPFIGKQDRIETVAELRIEMVCADEFVKDAIVSNIVHHL